MRKFETGATRDDNKDKPDYEGFLSPLVIQGFGDYMHRHRFQADGQVREADNWQKGMSKDSYMESGWRHFLDWWLEHDGYDSREGLLDALYGLFFNVQGYLHETIKADHNRFHGKIESEVKPNDSKRKTIPLRKAARKSNKLRVRSRARINPGRGLRRRHGLSGW